MNSSTPERPPSWLTAEKRAENSRRPWTLRSKLLTAAVVVAMNSLYLGRYEANQRTALIQKYSNPQANQPNSQTADQSIPRVELTIVPIATPAITPEAVPTFDSAEMVRKSLMRP